VTAGVAGGLAADLLAAIDLDDGAVAAALAGVSEAERRLAAPAVVAARREAFEAWRGSLDRALGERWLRAGLALLGCGTPAELRAARVWLPGWGAGIGILAERRPPWLRDWLARELEDSRDGSVWPGARALAQRGVVEPLLTDAAVAAMAMALARRRRPVADELREAPDLLEEAVWRLFEVEGGEVGSLARADKYSPPEHGWRAGLLELAAEGRLDRQRLLDASLAALQRDFPAFRAQWFSRFHEDLKPTRQERNAHAAAYLRLLASPAEATVSFAVRALTNADPEPAALASAIPAALASERKGTVLGALGLLQRAGGYGEVALGALQHPSSEVQARALDLLEAAPPPRDALLEYGEVVAPQVRDRWAALAGVPAAPAGLVAAAPRGAPPARAPDPPPERLTPPGDAHELAALLTRLLEQERPDPDELDLALDGVARLCGGREPLDGPLKPLLPRARRLAGERRVAALVLLAWADGVPMPPAAGFTTAAELQWSRAAEVAACAAAGRPCALLATPTHRGGRIDAPRAGEGAGPADAELARHRGPDAPAPPPVRVRLATFAREPFTWPVQIELGAPLPDGPVGDVWQAILFRGRMPGVRWQGGPAAVRQLRATWPAFEDGLAALGASLLVASHADSITGGSEFLRGLTGQLGEAAPALLAIGLGTDDDTAGLAAVDAAAAALAGGRLEAATLGTWVTGVVRHEIAPGRRVARRLRALAGHGHAAAVRVAIEDAPAASGRDAHHLLELLDDLCAQTGAPVASPRARAWLEARKGGSKTARLARSLLARG
jgi:Family of unknown function (DUF6493)